jgi:hypothetical protein
VAVEGVAGFSSIAPGAPDYGHGLGAAAVQNSPEGTRAYYYLSGMERTPAGETDTAHGTSLSGMASTAGYFLANSGSATLFTLRFGSAGADPARTWNLGADDNGLNWFGNPGSTLEERIYQADPSEVRASLFYQGDELLIFSYSDLYMAIDYGPTQNPNDDTIRAFSDPVAATKASGLAGFNDGLADALLADIGANGGGVQLNFHNIQPATRNDLVDDNYLYGTFAFDGALQLVPVPEPAATAALSGLGLLGFALWRRRRG